VSSDSKPVLHNWLPRFPLGNYNVVIGIALKHLDFPWRGRGYAPTQLADCFVAGHRLRTITPRTYEKTFVPPCPLLENPRTAPEIVKISTTFNYIVVL